MKGLNPEELRKKENYRLLTSLVTPRPIALVTSLSDAGVLNAAPFSYFNIVSADPPLISLAIGRKEGQQKDTCRNILHSNEFVVHVVTEDNVRQANEASASLKPDESEVVRAGMTPEPSQVVAVPSLKESPIRLECRLERHLILEGEESAKDLILSRIVHYEIEEKLIKDGDVRTDKLKPVSRLGGKQYAGLGSIFELERPDARK
ncbi:flavin reductase family protein [Alkalicoccus luteus]|uniref:Flavin reductase family protein n=1 Tax=Alkalicoccus luteus TaxID=1237094 RepID=A0A969TW66_9BACI|nr:flavin reductase family protein [Alkalicoccus luteus]NJP38751.1 flavin reductase family protein [Alkalicoccus luteus]